MSTKKLNRSFLLYFTGVVKIEGEWRYFDEELKILYPWYTKPCLEWLESIDITFMTIFEYGVGNSSNWFRAKDAYAVFGVDDNKAWVRDVFTTYEYQQEAYLKSIYEMEMKFDLIVIDGAFRDYCLEHALKCIHEGGFIIIDNYKQPSADLEHWPITETLIKGMHTELYKEPEHEDWKTLVIHV
jgi:hypothetical protein